METALWAFSRSVQLLLGGGILPTRSFVKDVTGGSVRAASRDVAKANSRVKDSSVLNLAAKVQKQRADAALKAAKGRRKTARISVGVGSAAAGAVGAVSAARDRFAAARKAAETRKRNNGGSSQK